MIANPLAVLAILGQASAGFLNVRNATQLASSLRNASQLTTTPRNSSQAFVTDSDGFLSFNYKAFGDSFAAGIGAGLLGDTTGAGNCWRTKDAYPELLNNALGGTHDKFDDNHFVACTGAKVDQINDQINSFMDDTVDIATISLGYVGCSST
jgi:hypothetical protein